MNRVSFNLSHNRVFILMRREGAVTRALSHNRALQSAINPSIPRQPPPRHHTNMARQSVSHLSHTGRKKGMDTPPKKCCAHTNNHADKLG